MWARAAHSNTSVCKSYSFQKLFQTAIALPFEEKMHSRATLHAGQLSKAGPAATQKKINKAFTEGKQKDTWVGFEYLLQLKRLMTIWWWDLSRLMETLPSCA